MGQLDAMNSQEWIKANVKFPHGACLFYSTVVAALFYPELKLIRGQHSAQREKDTCHYWCEDDRGIIIDPTAAQYQAGGTYFAPLELELLPYLRHILTDRGWCILLRYLPDADQQKLVDDWWFLAVEWGQHDPPPRPSLVHEVGCEEWKDLTGS